MARWKKDQYGSEEARVLAGPAVSSGATHTLSLEFTMELLASLPAPESLDF